MTPCRRQSCRQSSLVLGDYAGLDTVASKFTAPVIAPLGQGGQAGTGRGQRPSLRKMASAGGGGAPRGGDGSREKIHRPPPTPPPPPPPPGTTLAFKEQTLP